MLGYRFAIKNNKKLVGYVATCPNCRNQPEIFIKKVQISENLPQFKNGSWIEDRRSLAHYCAGQRNALWGPVETMTGEDIIGANGEIANCMFLLLAFSYCYGRGLPGIKNIMRGGLIVYILAENQAWVWIDSESNRSAVSVKIFSIIESLKNC